MESRGLRKELSTVTLEICKVGTYTTSKSQQQIDISEQMKKALAGTVLYRPNNQIPKPSHVKYETVVEVTAETTLQACHRLVKETDSGRVVVLSFASAKNPGGGFLNGSQAQEESLARSSGLYPCLIQKNEMYNENIRNPNEGLYSHYMIYSPDVPVFREDSGELIAPYNLSIITAPAVNRGVYAKSKNFSLTLMANVMNQRIHRILSIALEHKHTHIVLGAYGCGVFSQDPIHVANWFHTLLGQGGLFHGCFKKIVFAVYSTKKEDRNLMPFQQLFDF